MREVGGGSLNLPISSLLSSGTVLKPKWVVEGFEEEEELDVEYRSKPLGFRAMQTRRLDKLEHLPNIKVYRPKQKNKQTPPS